MTPHLPPIERRGAQVHRTDIPALVIAAGRVRDLLAHRCCGPKGCDGIGDHVWRATRDMAPGPRAASTDPRTSTHPAPGSVGLDIDPDRHDPTTNLHTRYRELLREAMAANLALVDFLDAHRPDRHVGPIATTTPDDWCAHHLHTLGVAAPRGDRGDLCNSCYRFQAAEGIAPPAEILRAWHDGRRLHDRDVSRIVARAKAERRKQRRRKAS